MIKICRGDKDMNLYDCSDNPEILNFIQIKDDIGRS